MRETFQNYGSILFFTWILAIGVGFWFKFDNSLVGQAKKRRVGKVTGLFIHPFKEIVAPSIIIYQ